MLALSSLGCSMNSLVFSATAVDVGSDIIWVCGLDLSAVKSLFTFGYLVLWCWLYVLAEESWCSDFSSILQNYAKVSARMRYPVLEPAQPRSAIKTRLDTLIWVSSIYNYHLVCNGKIFNSLKQLNKYDINFRIKWPLNHKSGTLK